MTTLTMIPYRSAISQSKMKHQTPMPAGDTITYHLSKGPEEITIPMLLVLRKHRQPKKLESAGFKVRTQDKSKGNQNATVSAVSPSVGSKGEKGDTVTITIGEDPKKQSVPNVIGKSTMRLSSFFKEAGFTKHHMGLRQQRRAVKSSASLRSP